jgi:hypothetical protein
MHPVIELHGIEVKDDRFEFSSVSPCTGMSESELPAETKTTVILYEDITSISPFEARIEVLLECGALYLFHNKQHQNAYKYI